MNGRELKRRKGHRHHNVIVPLHLYCPKCFIAVSVNELVMMSSDEVTNRDIQHIHAVCNTPVDIF